MFDARLRPLIDPPLNHLGRLLSRIGIGANAVTLAGLVPALMAAGAIANEMYLAGLFLIIINRVFDGLDGAIARTNGITGFGGYLDTLADYVFYVAVPIGFAFAIPANTPASLLLVASFTLTSVSFLAFAAITAKLGRQEESHGTKSFNYSTGLAEGAETIVAFLAMCIFPQQFVIIAIGFAILCILTVLQRIYVAYYVFAD